MTWTIKPSKSQNTKGEVINIVLDKLTMLAGIGGNKFLFKVQYAEFNNCISHRQPLSHQVGGNW